METIERKTCRLCGGETFKDILSLGDIYVSDFVQKSKVQDGIKAPLDLVLCGDCELLQLRHTAPQELLYARHYWYKSALNKVIVDDLRELAEIAESFMQPLDTILDIGANDGTLLSFVDPKFVRIGCEPADNLQKDLEKNCDIAIHDFWSIDKYEYPRAKVVLAIGMFYDMEDPNQFVRDAAKAMTDDGIFIAQLMTLKPMLEKNDFANICHEHLEYYSYKNLVRLFETNGLEIFKVEENSINGGSYRLFARKLSKGSIQHEESYSFLLFTEHVKRSKERAVEFVKVARAEGKKIYGYGASTKGNTILQYYNLDNVWIEGIADKNPDKIGKYTVGTGIPIVDQDKVRAEADYFFILPWGFTDTFVKEEREKGFKGKFIVSIPEFRVI